MKCRHVVLLIIELGHVSRSVLNVMYERENKKPYVPQNNTRDFTCAGQTFSFVALSALEARESNAETSFIELGIKQSLIWQLWYF